MQEMKKEEVKHISISDYNYELPDERIAKYPLQRRDDSKLLLYKDGAISYTLFNQLPNLLPEKSLIIFNDTRVIHARLIFEKETGAHVEVFCLSPVSPADYAVNFSCRQSCSWHCIIGNAKRWKEGELSMKIVLNDVILTLKAEKESSSNNGTTVRFNWDNDEFAFSEVLEMAGKLPIPPYLNRASEKNDDNTYQTVYSKVDGSVAAPTAGLHFTEEVMGRLEQKDISVEKVTLHVGAGTFKPVKSLNIGGHDMHTEFISVNRSTIESLYLNKGNLIVVGTTSMRTIESLYYIGKKIGLHQDIHNSDLTVMQWDPYENDDEHLSSQDALKNILDYLDRNNLDRLISSTRIIIAPGYKFKYADGLITNFHQPQSTLLLLIAAFVGADWKTIYNYAMNESFRFLSYGDSSLLWKNRK